MSSHQSYPADESPTDHSHVPLFAHTMVVDTTSSTCGKCEANLANLRADSDGRVRCADCRTELMFLATTYARTDVPLEQQLGGMADLMDRTFPGLPLEYIGTAVNGNRGWILAQAMPR